MNNNILTTNKFYFDLLVKLFFLIIILTTGFSRAQSLNGSFESKFKRYQKNESFTGIKTNHWNVVAWKGERIHKQIVLWSTKDINGIDYEVKNLENETDAIHSSNIKLRFGKYVKGDPEARSCSEYPIHMTSVEISDALSTVQIDRIESTDPLKVWVTIDVPISASAGNYNGTIKVEAGGESLVFNIEVIVVDYTLPEVSNWGFHLDLWQFPVNILNHYNTENPGNRITIWSDNHFALLEPAYKLLADTGQKAITTYIKDGSLGEESMIKWTKKANGTWEYDFSVFDKYVSTLMSWGITKQIDCFSPVGWNEAVIPYWDEATNTMINLNAPLGSISYNTRWSNFLTAFKIHLDSKGWFDKAVLYLDEVSEEKLQNVVSVVLGNNINWKLGIAYSHGLSDVSKSNFYDLSGILEDASNDGITEDKISTFYTSCTQTIPNNYVTPENNPSEMTWIGWFATRENYDGYLRWAFDNWQLSDPFDARDGAHTAGDFSMVYRASNNAPSEILTSVRMEMLREGIQDFEKLKILKASLRNSSNSYDHEVLNELNKIINNFSKTSGNQAEQLIIEGQKAIEEISLGTFSYCEINGGQNEDYYVTKLTSSGGDTELNYSTNQFPSSGYVHHKTSKVSVLPEKTITLNLENSAKSICARTMIWIDWNNDKDFEDTGEQVFSAGSSGSCSNSLTYSIPIIIPNNVDQGIVRARLQINENEPTSCGVGESSSTLDFDIEILDVYCSVSGTGNYNASVVTTTGGIENIDYSGISGANNYEYNKDKVSIARSVTFSLSVTNSNGWSRTIAWVDWNGDNDFGDEGEQLEPLSPEKVVAGTTPTYLIDIKVPLSAKVGVTRMRVLTGDAWTYEDTAIPSVPCNILEYESTLENAAIKDFVVEVISSLGLNDIYSRNKFLIYPNPINGKLTIQFPEINFLPTGIFIINRIGQIVFEKKIDSFQSPEIIEVPLALKKGIYFLKVFVQNKYYTNKLIIS